MPLEYPKETPSQTAGPFVHIGTMPRLAGIMSVPGLGTTIAGPEVDGARIAIEGHVRDGTGTPCRDMMIEVWQADPQGIYPHPQDPRADRVAPGFSGFGRVATDFETGLFRIETVKPGPVPGRDGGLQAPHLTLWLVARGVNVGLHTRMYFGDERNDDDPLLGMIEQPARRATLIADPAGEGLYRFDIHLQGEKETVFLDV